MNRTSITNLLPIFAIAALLLLATSTTGMAADIVPMTIGPLINGSYNQCLSTCDQNAPSDKCKECCDKTFKKHTWEQQCQNTGFKYCGPDSECKKQFYLACLSKKRTKDYKIFQCSGQ